jgi:hypothetical protein
MPIVILIFVGSNICPNPKSAVKSKSIGGFKRNVQKIYFLEKIPTYLPYTSEFRLGHIYESKNIKITIGIFFRAV